MARLLAPVLDGYSKIIAYSGDDKKLLLRKAAEQDLFFLMTIIMQRVDMRHQWVLDRCDEVQAHPDGFIDLWARAHYKSSISVGKILQDLMIDPETPIGIFSHTRPSAKQFIRQIKDELERNVLFREIWPDRVWDNPKAEAPSWSLDDGITLKRKGNPKEASVEAWGIIDGQPIGKHYGICVYDDLVTRDNAGSPEMRGKTLGAWELSLNLGLNEGTRRRYYGTRYHFEDVYNEIIKRGAAIPRVYPAEVDGASVLLSPEELSNKRRDMGPVTYAAQMMLDPKSDGAVGFKPEWRRYWDGKVADGNTYMLVDPANSKRKKSDYTSVWALRCCPDQNYYILDMIRDRINLTERCDLVMAMHRKWKPNRVGYEQYGMQADIEALRWRMNEDGYRFDVVPLGGAMSKFERISKLIPLFENGRIWSPRHNFRMSHDLGTETDMVAAFEQEEYLAWPYSGHDDMLDSLARIVDEDLGVVWPKEAKAKDYKRQRRSQPNNWMAA